jgi:hypothetical protein
MEAQLSTAGHCPSPRAQNCKTSITGSTPVAASKVFFLNLALAAQRSVSLARRMPTWCAAAVAANRPLSGREDQLRDPRRRLFLHRSNRV